MRKIGAPRTGQQVSLFQCFKKLHKFIHLTNTGQQCTKGWGRAGSQPGRIPCVGEEGPKQVPQYGNEGGSNRAV